MISHAASKTRRLVRPDAILQGEEVAAGPAFLLLHAGGERRQVWTPVIEILVDAGFRCVAFDQRGHGDSDGSARALSPCADDVAAMLCAEPLGCVVVGASLGGLAAVAALSDPAVRARVAGLVLVDVVPYTELVEDILARVPRLRQVTAELDLPVLLVHGDSGSSVTAEDIDQLLRLAPHTTVRPIHGAGHLIAHDQPVKLAQAILSVVTR